MMGTRYWIHVTCPSCGACEDNVYYAPTCGFVEWPCRCGRVVDLEEYTGISHDEASNIDEMRNLVSGGVKEADNEAR